MDPFVDLRKEYSLARLDEASANPDPIRMFQAWFDDALKAGAVEPNAMTVATVDADGQPSARIMLLKGVDDAGFVFYTNYESRKGRELAQNPRAALLFWWPSLERQVRIEGTVARVSAAESDAYFATRPRLSQLGAHVSAQSNVIENREFLERAAGDALIRFAGTPIPRPDRWGGFRLSPNAIEFWQGRESRMHDRLLYARTSATAWTIQRLSP